MILSILILILLTVVTPILIGAGVAAHINKQERNVVFMWAAGTILSWALFQILAVGMILKWQSFHTLVLWYGVCLAAAAVAGVISYLLYVKKRPALAAVKTAKTKREWLLWGVFAAGLLLQLVLAVVLAYGDGDDAYYVATSTVTVQTDTMYRQLPYLGGSTWLDIRHCLAPFPILIAFYAKVSGMHPAIVSHIVMPVLLIPLTYAIYGMIGSRLLVGRKRYLPAFLVFVSVLVMWGNYSLYTAETFLITRSRQGKAALGNAVIPLCFLLFFLIGERLSENRRIEKSLWVLVFATVTSAALCSALGGFLAAMLLGIFGLCVLISYRKWRILPPLLVCLLPAALYVGLYVYLR